MIVKSLDHLNTISKVVSQKLENGDCIFLIGEIGVGKTTFTRYLINNLQNQRGLKETEVLSPTFNLLYEYEIKGLKIISGMKSNPKFMKLNYLAKKELFF